MLREWNVSHGFIYAPVSETNRPDPNLKLPDREVRTPSGKVLIPITSSSMIRQVYELSANKIQIQGHLTGLIPLRAENAPDVWEIKSLQTLQQGKKEFSEVGSLNGRSYFRMMWALTAQARCLTCHGGKGFKEGDLLGGLSISVPMQPFWETGQNQHRTIWGGHLALWLLGLAGIGLGGSQLSRKMKEQLRVEKALRESQERFTNIIDSSLEVIWEIDREGRYTYLSPTVEEVLGYAPEELLGKPFYDLFCLEERESFFKNPFSAREKHENFRNFRNRHVRKDGQIIWLLTSGVPFYDEENQFLGYRGTNIDVTARKKAEDILIGQKRLLEAFNQIFQKALDCRTEEELAQVCLSKAEELTGSKMGWIGEINSAGLLDTIALTDPGWENCRIPHKEAPLMIRNMEIRGIWGGVIKEEKTHIVNDPGGHPDRVGLPAGHPSLTSFLGVPLKLKGQIIGMIALGNKEAGYTETDRQSVEHLAPVVIEALHRKRAERKLKEKEELWKIIMESVGAGVVLIDQESCTIVEANPFAAKMIGLSRDQVIGRSCRQFFHGDEEGQCPLQYTARTEKAERVLLTAQGSRVSILKTVVPVVKDGHPYLLESFIDLTEQRQAEEALSRANAHLQVIVQEVGQTNRDMNLLRELGELLQLCPTFEEALPILEEFVGRLFPEEGGELFLLNNSRNLLEAVSSWGKSNPRGNVFSPEECWALRRGKSHLVTALNSSSSKLTCSHLHSGEPGADLCVPLTAQGETLGLIHLHRGLIDDDAYDAFAEEQPGTFNEARIKFVESAAENVSLALSNLKLREKLRQQAIRDPLTGLFNKRYLQETLEREVERAKRSEQPLGVLMLDLDHFKRFNDTYGHEAGDELLRSFGRLVKSIIRVEDIACRYGGEEFTLIMPECPLNSLLERAEEIRQAVERIQVNKGGEMLGLLTVSIGAAVFPDQGAHGEVLLQMADSALYQAKKAGRNRVVAAGEFQKDPVPAQGKTRAA
jgi:diguanylate cyclase (GGDEF)-like protein/PAS domain S-box-containing protein